MSQKTRIPKVLFCALTALTLTACGQQLETNTVPLPPAKVAVIQTKPETVTIADELPGRVAALRTAEIRSQVGGIIEKRLFEEGTEVKAGQVLFQINPEPFKADVDSAKASLQRAQAGLVRAEAKLNRSKQLISTKAISSETYDTAIADHAQARADVAQARATLHRRQLDLDFATVRAPISGRIGSALVSEGALVSASATNALAIIQQIDQVNLDVRQPAAHLDVIQAAVKSGQLATASELPVAIFSASGKPYPMMGWALFSDISVDPGTGNVTVRVVVDNADRILLPGMYVRARLPRGILRDALLVPEEAVVRDSMGRPQLLIVDEKKTATRRNVELGDLIEGRYIVDSGVKADETVIVQGQERVQEGAAVETVAYSPNTIQTRPGTGG